jgi:hypothetical protein
MIRAESTAGLRAAYAFGVRVPCGHGEAVVRARVGHRTGRTVILGACNPGER